MFGLSPADELKKGTMNMAINWASYIAYVHSENEEYQKANEKTGSETIELGRFIEEYKEQSTSRG